jgi:hypothetical protein
MRKHLILLLFLASACETAGIEAPTDPDEPTDLVYQLVPSGDPEEPAGIMLYWNPPRSGRAVSYDVYARSSRSGEFGLRATTTSPSFHDAGFPQLQYFVEATDEDGLVLGSTDAIEVDERNRLPAPMDLTSVTLNGAVQLQWDQNAVEADPEMFDFYRVYSTSWSSAGGCEPTEWALEGSTVSDGFLSRNLPNGITRCFAISAISRDGHESLWSNVRQDTPRHDARSIVVDASDVRPATSAFRFMSGSTFGTVVSDTSSQADVVLERRIDGALWFRAARPESRLTTYGVAPVSELTSIDRAPVTGYGDAARVLAGYGYVFRIQYADGVRHAAVRVLHVANDYIVFDYSVQSQIGSVELLRTP